MNTKHVLRRAALCAGAVSILSAAAAEAPHDWENLAVNSRNRLPPRTYAMPLADEAAALTDRLEPETPYALSLNGTWKISWAGDPALRLKDFYRADLDDASWLTVDVPACVETRGFGSPGYTNVRYPHANKYPKILDRDNGKPDYNPVSSYRTRFTVPAAWAGRDVILRFDGVYSAYYVWVNGRQVGYAEDSKLPSEFDVTPYLNAPGRENVLAVEVYRWCDGSYVEDQDMFRFSGIFRDVTLWAKPKDGIWDFCVKTALENDYRDARLSLAGLDGAWSATLYDAAKKPVAALAPAAPSAKIAGVRPWSAEDPYLYTLVVKKGADIRMRRVGFKEQKIVGNLFLVNGKPVKFKGVNRHECNPDSGRTVTMDDMLRDVTLFKRYNINTVRTCHYPDHHSWYDLCDRYGVYVVAEANVEGHEPGYKPETSLGNKPEFDHTIVERNVRHAVFYRNHPAVTMWSMGNETGHGDGFRHAIAGVRKADPTRPIHWERGNADADIDSTMYPTVEWLEKRGNLGDAKKGSLQGEGGGQGFAIGGHTAGKAHFMCEYAHAMGNAVGNFQEYWDVIYAHPSLTGGCIWDWVDQALWKYTDRLDPKTGRRERFYAYGGDWDEEPHDGPFCCNGVVDPVRNVSAKLVEIGHVYRNLVVRGDGKGGFTLENRNLFLPADRFDGRWEIVEDGEVVRRGAFAVPPVAPLATAPLALDFGAWKPAAGRETFVNVAFLTREDRPWAKAGWTVALNQVKLAGDWNFAARVAPGASAKGVRFAADERTVTAFAGATKAVFCRKSGTLCELVMDGKAILRDAAPGLVSGPRLTCERAFTDNDRWLRDGGNWGEDRRAGGFYSRGLSQLVHHAHPIAVEGHALKVTVEVTGSKSAGFVHEATWSFSDDGRIVVANRVTPHGTMPPALPRLGVSLVLDASLETADWYGRGPRENYVDRLTGSFLGRWRSSVTDLFEDYVRPQDNGYRSDVRWVAFTDSSGRGVRFAGSEPLFVQALHHSCEDLEMSRHRAGQKRYRAPLVARDEVYLNLDVRQCGLGGASCGPRPMEKYTYRAAPAAWTYAIEPYDAH